MATPIPELGPPSSLEVEPQIHFAGRRANQPKCHGGIDPLTLDELQYLMGTTDIQDLVVRTVIHWKTGPVPVFTTESQHSTTSDHDPPTTSIPDVQLDDSFGSNADAERPYYHEFITLETFPLPYAMAQKLPKVLESLRPTTSSMSSQNLREPRPAVASSEGSPSRDPTRYEQIAAEASSIGLTLRIDRGQLPAPGDPRRVDSDATEIPGAHLIPIDLIELVHPSRIFALPGLPEMPSLHENSSYLSTTRSGSSFPDWPSSTVPIFSFHSPISHSPNDPWALRILDFVHFLASYSRPESAQIYTSYEWNTWELPPALIRSLTRYRLSWNWTAVGYVNLDESGTESSTQRTSLESFPSTLYPVLNPPFEQLYQDETGSYLDEYFVREEGWNGVGTKAVGLYPVERPVASHTPESKTSVPLPARSGSRPNTSSSASSSRPMRPLRPIHPVQSTAASEALLAALYRLPQRGYLGVLMSLRPFWENVMLHPDPVYVGVVTDCLGQLARWASALDAAKDENGRGIIEEVIHIAGIICSPTRSAIDVSQSYHPYLVLSLVHLVSNSPAVCLPRIRSSGLVRNMTRTLEETGEFELVEVVEIMFTVLAGTEEGAELLMAPDGGTRNEESGDDDDGSGGAVKTMLRRASLDPSADPATVDGFCHALSQRSAKAREALIQADFAHWAVEQLEVNGRFPGPILSALARLLAPSPGTEGSVNQPTRTEGNFSPSEREMLAQSTVPKNLVALIEDHPNSRYDREEPHVAQGFILRSYSLRVLRLLASVNTWEGTRMSLNLDVLSIELIACALKSPDLEICEAFDALMLLHRLHASSFPHLRLVSSSSTSAGATSDPCAVTGPSSSSDADTHMSRILADAPNALNLLLWQAAAPTQNNHLVSQAGSLPSSSMQPSHPAGATIESIAFPSLPSSSECAALIDQLQGLGSKCATLLRVARGLHPAVEVIPVAERQEEDIAKDDEPPEVEQEELPSSSTTSSTGRRRRLFGSPKLSIS